MPLDPSIILGARPPQIDMAQFSPMNALTNVMKFKQADQETQINALKMREYERAREEEQGLREFVGGSKGMAPADLSLPETRTNLLKYGKAGATFAEALSKQEIADLTQKEAKFKVQKARQDFVAQAQRDISQNPSDANITAYKEDLMANDLFTEAEKKQMAAASDRILAMPINERTPFLASKGASASELKPTFTSQDLGATGRLISKPAFGGAATVVPGSEFTKSKTFADITSERQASTSERQAATSAKQASTSAGQLALAQRKFAWEQANPGFEIKETEDGSIVGVNKRTLQAFPVSLGGPVSAEPATSTGIPTTRLPVASNLPQSVAPVPLMGKGTTMTETQSNAAMFGGAMNQAQKTIKDLEKSGTVRNAVVPKLLTGLAQLVPFGVGENIGNVIESTFNADPTGLIGPNADQQKLAQAQLAFATAYLRKTSGAAFGASEVSNTIKEFFPLVGEGEKVIAQKAAARDRAIEGMKISTNKEGRKYIENLGGGNAPAGGGGITNATSTNPLGLTLPGVR
jgi:hypothetical protein